MFPLAKTLASIKKSRLISLMLGCALLAIIIIIIMVILVVWAVSASSNFETTWLNTLTTSLAGILGVIAGWFMLPSLTILIGGMFQETVIGRVEDTYYPDAVRKESPKFWPDFFHDVRFTIKSVLLNILVFPFYFFAVGFIISILLNTYLLGREFFETAAGHHIGKAEANKILKQNKTRIYGGGLIITVLNLVPLLNIFMPVIGMVWMVHVYQDIRLKKQEMGKKN